jgi:hypothetical protein
VHKAPAPVLRVLRLAARLLELVALAAFQARARAVRTVKVAKARLSGALIPMPSTPSRTGEVRRS